LLEESRYAMLDAIGLGDLKITTDLSSQKLIDFPMARHRRRLPYDAIHEHGMIRTLPK